DGAGEEGWQEPALRLGRFSRTRWAALLSRAIADVPDRVRQHPERRQPYPLSLARLQRRFRLGCAKGALPDQPPVNVGQADSLPVCRRGAGLLARYAAIRGGILCVSL